MGADQSDSETDWKFAPLAVALGDPAGIGPEIVAKAWMVREAHKLPPFFAIGDIASVRQVWNGPVEPVTSPDEASTIFSHALPCLQTDFASDSLPGVPGTQGTHVALQALEIGIGLAKAGSASALVTAPVSKSALYTIGFTHPGQTEFIAERCGIAAENAVMMLAGQSLRVVPLTVHLPLRAVPDALSIDLICGRARITTKGLQRQFGIERPRLWVSGLNPHAGEDGALGLEEREIIAPAIARLQEEGLDVSGPFAADGMFHARARECYDAALCMYHDQALIPIKTLYFDEGVNMTLGLPIIRTSPDHGTAFGIAGKNIAHPGAMIAAIRMARQAVIHRRNNAD